MIRKIILLVDGGAGMRVWCASGEEGVFLLVRSAWPWPVFAVRDFDAHCSFMTMKRRYTGVLTVLLLLTEGAAWAILHWETHPTSKF